MTVRLRQRLASIPCSAFGIAGTILALVLSHAAKAQEPVDLGASACFEKPADAIHRVELEPGSFHRLVRPPSGHTFDYRGERIERLPSDHLLSVQEPADVCIIGPTVIGTQSRGLTWSQVKRGYDFGGVHIGRIRPGAEVVVEGARIVNVEDGLMMPRSPQANGMGITWALRHSWMEHIRDDAIENDACLDGTIEDVLIEEAHMGLAARPGRDTDPATLRKASWTVDGLLLHLSRKPVAPASRTGACPARTGVAQLFKMSACFGSMRMRNSVLRVDALAQRPAAMGFPPGSYENVTLVWLGPGDYPVPLPAGVTLTRDVAVWTEARASWLARHGCDDRTRTCRMDGTASAAGDAAPSPLAGAGDGCETAGG